MSLGPRKVVARSTVNIIARDNGAGLSRDIDLLYALFRTRGWRVLVNGRRSRHPGEMPKRIALRAMRELSSLGIASRVMSPRWALNLHLEDIAPPYIPLARRNVLIPNQEYFREFSRPHLSKMDVVLTKSRHAEQVFTHHGCDARFVGWRSMDRRTSRTLHSDATALHVAGRSQLKGTDAVLDAWVRHPEWPTIVVVRQRLGYDDLPLPWTPRAFPTNVRLIDERVSNERLKELQNSIPIHIAPSEAEGFGHVLVESMSVGAVIITTDAAPMNELITGARGILVDVAQSEPMNFGHLARVSVDDLERKIQAAFNMPLNERDALGRSARAWFEDNDHAFEPRFWTAIESICR